MGTKPHINLASLIHFDIATLAAESKLMYASTVDELRSLIKEDLYCNNEFTKVVVKRENDHYNLYVILCCSNTLYIRRIATFDDTFKFEILPIVAANNPFDYFQCYAESIFTKSRLHEFTESDYIKVKSGKETLGYIYYTNLLNELSIRERVLLTNIQSKLNKECKESSGAADAVYNLCVAYITKSCKRMEKSPYDVLISLDRDQLKKSSTKLTPKKGGD